MDKPLKGSINISLFNDDINIKLNVDVRNVSPYLKAISKSLEKIDKHDDEEDDKDMTDEEYSQFIKSLRESIIGE